MFHLGGHTSKADRLRRSHDADLGYELGSALVVDAADGRPLGAREFRLRTAAGMLSTRPGGGAEARRRDRRGHGGRRRLGVGPRADPRHRPRGRLDRPLPLRPAVHNTGGRTPAGHKAKRHEPGPPLPLRLIVTRVVDASGGVLAEWWLLSNVADAATIGRRYAWRWRIEGHHKLLKSGGMNAESWRQAEGEPASCLRVALVRLSGRLMKRGVESTAPSLLEGPGRLLVLDDLRQSEDLVEILALARRLLPRHFPDRSG